jgi:F-type H+-transporting ATPase subunit alpha
VTVPSQIAVLLALTAGLFDDVPLDRMTDVEQAVRESAAEIPAEVRVRLDTAEKLSDEDRETIIEIARKALEAFQPKPDPEEKS